MNRITPLFALALTAALTLPGCRDEPTASAPPGEPAAPTLTRVTAERSDLLFRYRADDGFASATTIDEIPEDARGAVQVIDLSLSPEARGSASTVQVFDLRAPGPDGAYPGRLMPRAALEQALAEAQATPAQAAVTMYSAAWCGVCNKARKFLTDKGIAFVEKDIEKDAGAARELAEKARRAGVDAGGVPVFDIGGRIVPGFDGPRLLELIRGA